jgi:hypothetical protein
MVPRKNPFLMNYSDEQIKQRYILMLIIKNNGGIIVQVIYNYGLHEKLISIIIKLRKGYLPRGPMNRGKITLSRFNNYGY